MDRRRNVTSFRAPSFFFQTQKLSEVEKLDQHMSLSAPAGADCASTKSCRKIGVITECCSYTTGLWPWPWIFWPFFSQQNHYPQEFSWFTEVFVPWDSGPSLGCRWRFGCWMMPGTSRWLRCTFLFLNEMCAEIGKKFLINEHNDSDNSTKIWMGCSSRFELNVGKGLLHDKATDVARFIYHIYIYISLS